jgi:hypothetical protein
LKGTVTSIQKDITIIKKEVTVHGNILDNLTSRSCRQEAEIKFLEKAIKESC